MKRKENAIKHLNTEINWLNELDDETEHKYSNAIAYRIFITKCFLYQNEAIKKRDLINGYLQLSFSNKILFIRKLFKKALRTDCY